MKKIIAMLIIVAAVCSACNSGSNNKASDPTATKTNATSSPDDNSTNGSGHISCQIDGKDWTSNNAEATQTGNAFLNIASGSDQKDAISIIQDHPATGTFNFNQGVSGSYTDATGASFGSVDATGNLTVTSYTAPNGNTPGKVEGSFSGTFKFDPTKKVTITAGTFSMPVKKL